MSAAPDDLTPAASVYRALWRRSCLSRAEADTIAAWACRTDPTLFQSRLLHLLCGGDGDESRNDSRCHPDRDCTLRTLNALLDAFFAAPGSPGVEALHCALAGVLAWPPPPSQGSYIGYFLRTADPGSCGAEVPAVTVWHSRLLSEISNRVWPACLGQVDALAHLSLHPQLSRAVVGRRAVELGAGTGLGGLLLAHHGAARFASLTLTDGDAAAVLRTQHAIEEVGDTEDETAAQQHKLCASSPSPRVLLSSSLLEWGADGDGELDALCAAGGADVIFGSDLCYDVTNHAPLLHTVVRLLSAAAGPPEEPETILHGDRPGVVPDTRIGVVAALAFPADGGSSDDSATPYPLLASVLLGRRTINDGENTPFLQPASAPTSLDRLMPPPRRFALLSECRRNPATFHALLTAIGSVGASMGLRVADVTDEVAALVASQGGSVLDLCTPMDALREMYEREAAAATEAAVNQTAAGDADARGACHTHVRGVDYTSLSGSGAVDYTSLSGSGGAAVTPSAGGPTPACASINVGGDGMPTAPLPPPYPAAAACPRSTPLMGINAAAPGSIDDVRMLLLWIEE